MTRPARQISDARAALDELRVAADVCEIDESPVIARQALRIRSARAFLAALASRPEPPTRDDAELRATLDDALAGWRYIRAHHGDLYGVGWDRVEQRLTAAIADLTTVPA